MIALSKAEQISKEFLSEMNSLQIHSKFRQLILSFIHCRNPQFISFFTLEINSSQNYFDVINIISNDMRFKDFRIINQECRRFTILYSCELSPAEWLLKI